MRTQVLKSLAYFDIFNHPLTKEEIEQLCNVPVKEVIGDLLDNKVCYQFEGYYSLQEKVQPLVEERLRKEDVAASYLAKLPFYSRLIKAFPFVRSVSVSGSLSKGVMYDEGDIDYFIITKKNRLWICRTFLILFKKVFLLNSRKYFCVNYFVDEEHLEIVDKNIFTAIEVSHLVPVYNVEMIQKMREQNAWIKAYLPNYPLKQFIPPYSGNSLMKRLIEGIIRGQFAEWLDTVFMRLTYKRWQKKFGHFGDDKFELTMRSDRGISKHHPSDFQTKVLHAYKERMEQLSIKDEGTVYA